MSIGTIAEFAARAGGFACAFAAALFTCLTSARADELTSKGTVLKGTVKSLSSAGVVFAPEYGEGTLAIKWADVENVNTAGPVQVLYGDAQEANAPIAGFSNGKLLVGESETAAVAVDPASIVAGQPIGAEGPTFEDRMRSRWRYWDGSFDVAFSLAQSALDTSGFYVGLNSKRSKGPNRLLTGASYRYGKGESESDVVDASGNVVDTKKEKETLQDEIKGRLRGEHDFTRRFYLFGSGDAEYDSIEEISLRAVPKAGPGWTVFLQELDEKRQNFLKLELGPSWVYQKYFGGEDENFWAAALGALATYYLPYDSRFDWTFDYLPAVDDFAGTYLIRTGAALSIPMLDPLSLKASAMDEYNSQPTDDADHNSLFVNLGLSLGW